MDQSLFFFTSLLIFIGALLRFVISKLFSFSLYSWGTLVVNTLACLLMGLCLALSLMHTLDTKLLTPIYGLLGALSTFSTFSHDTLMLYRNNGILLAAINIFANIFLGLASFALGFFSVVYFL